MDQLSPRERVLTVIQRKEPDRVPHFEFIIDDPIIEALTHGGTYADLIELQDHDAVVAKVDYQSKKIGDNQYIDEWGIIRVKGIMQAMVAIDEFATIKNFDDFIKWSPPDPFAEGRLRTLKALISRFKGKRAIFIHVRDVWSLPRDLMGYTDLMIACITKPELVSAIVEIGVNHNIRMVEQAASVGAELVLTGDDIADNHSTLVSPKMWEELFAPQFKRLIDAFHGLGLYHWKHSDGNLMPVMDSLIKAGIDGIDPVDPLAGMSLRVIKEKYGGLIAIKGNIDCVNTLVNGTRKQVINEVKDNIRVAGPGGGYVCSSSNSIHSGVKPDLYKDMVEAIREYGTYPLDMERLSQNE